MLLGAERRQSVMQQIEGQRYLLPTNIMPRLMYNCDSHIHCVFVVVVANIIFSDQNTK